MLISPYHTCTHIYTHTHVCASQGFSHWTKLVTQFYFRPRWYTLMFLIHHLHSFCVFSFLFFYFLFFKTYTLFRIVFIMHKLVLHSPTNNWTVSVFFFFFNCVKQFMWNKYYLQKKKKNLLQTVLFSLITLVTSILVFFYIIHTSNFFLNLQVSLFGVEDKCKNHHSNKQRQWKWYPAHILR